jgi:hypothetical protein
MENACSDKSLAVLQQGPNEVDGVVCQGEAVLKETIDGAIPKGLNYTLRSSQRVRLARKITVTVSDEELTERTRERHLSSEDE